ncbi:hypothetical protein IT417_04045 [bacterium]|nr:hypothetical protein [bacterium]
MPRRKVASKLSSPTFILLIAGIIIFFGTMLSLNQLLINKNVSETDSEAAGSASAACKVYTCWSQPTYKYSCKWSKRAGIALSNKSESKFDKKKGTYSCSECGKGGCKGKVEYIESSCLRKGAVKTFEKLNGVTCIL